MTDVYSMTGFGKASGTGPQGEEVRVEVRSFNSKTLKLTLRLPSLFAPHEEEARALVRKFVRRGSGSITVGFRSPADLPDVQINSQLLETYARALEVLGEKLGAESRIDLARLAALPGAIEILEADREASREEIDLLLACLEEALKHHADTRRAEGKILAEDLRERASITLARLESIREKAPKVVEAYRDRLERRVKELAAGKCEVDPEAFQAEVVVFAERSDIHEECVRARSHLENFLNLLDGGGELGRRLDFVAQEIHRELNTINSKANDYEISCLAVEAKAEIDKIKEQIQNVE